MILSITVSDNVVWTGYIDDLHSSDYRLAFQPSAFLKTIVLAANPYRHFCNHLLTRSWQLHVPNIEIQNYRVISTFLCYVNRNPGNDTIQQPYPCYSVWIGQSLYLSKKSESLVCLSQFWGSYSPAKRSIPLSS